MKKIPVMTVLHKGSSKAMKGMRKQYRKMTRKTKRK